MTRVLGAILAGGRASRFGSDKALAMLDGRRLIDRVADAIAPQVDGVVVVGRDHPGMACAPDRPGPDRGPLGGLAGALHHAAAQGFDQVLSLPCDAPGIPRDLRMLLSATGHAAFLPALPVVGWWPVATLATLDTLLAGPGSHSMRAFADAIGARGCTTPVPIANVNTPGDLDRLSAHRD